ncbi:MAG: chemotaxis protein CheW [Gammaproteobacteria bacterium]|nr:chemotaxis protein CheW [Gammaproteobacteria bacterium]
MAQKEYIKSIILTLKNELVVVPNASVAEIISVQDVREVEDSPRWMLGKARWRGVEVPVVSYEAAGGDDAQAVNINTQVAVMYSVSEDGEYPYVGLAMHGVPHVSTFSRDQIRTDEQALSEHPMVAQKVRINGAAAGILDLFAIEEMLQQAAA